MLVDLLLVVGGLALLVFGGEALVRGAGGIALLLRVTPAVVGLTVVAAGTSMPELVVSVRAAVAGSPGLAMGNIVGSNIFNIAAILGIVALVRPLRIGGNTVRLEWPVMFLAAVQLHLLARDGLLDRLEGAFLALAIVAFTAYSVWIARRAGTAEQSEFAESARTPGGAPGRAAWLRNVGAVVVGVAALAVGASLLVRGSVSLARTWGVSETVIGLTIVAAGTSTPELVTSLVAAFRGRDDVAVANVVGSNVFNALGIGGITALVHPVPVPPEVVARDDWWMIGTSAALFPLMRSGMRITRLEGAVLLAAFVAYTTLLLRGA